ncbi:MAG: hypothetical protein QXJ93_01880 [Candidatus Rehaiarchaeum fermentans]|nr:hypothetical protein [Candidatus Rehaiarchaeum fermentans]
MKEKLENIVKKVSKEITNYINYIKNSTGYYKNSILFFSVGRISDYSTTYFAINYLKGTEGNPLQRKILDYGGFLGLGIELIGEIGLSYLIASYIDYKSGLILKNDFIKTIGNSFLYSIGLTSFLVSIHNLIGIDKISNYLEAFSPFIAIGSLPFIYFVTKNRKNLKD